MSPRNEETASEHPPTRSSRLTFALRQAISLGGCLILGGLVVERLRPEAAGDRGFVSTPFFWAAAIWVVLLLLDALAFRHSQLRRLDRAPLAAGGIAGALVFVVGLTQFSTGTTSSRLAYLLGNAVGAAVFWWGIAGLALLLWLLASNADVNPPSTPEPAAAPITDPIADPVSDSINE